MVTEHLFQKLDEKSLGLVDTHQLLTVLRGLGQAPVAFAVTDPLHHLAMGKGVAFFVPPRSNSRLGPQGPQKILLGGTMVLSEHWFCTRGGKGVAQPPLPP